MERPLWLDALERCASFHLTSHLVANILFTCLSFHIALKAALSTLLTLLQYHCLKRFPSNPLAESHLPLSQKRVDALKASASLKTKLSVPITNVTLVQA